MNAQAITFLSPKNIFVFELSTHHVKTWLWMESLTNVDFCIRSFTSLTGALQGYNKDTAWKELGLDQELVMQMRRSYDVRPPRMEDDHFHWHGNDRR